MNASLAKEIIFTGGTTEGINFIATAWGYKNIKAGDEIVVTQLEHHANFVPWQQLCKQTGAILKVIPVDKDGQLNIENIDQWIGSKTKLVAVTQVSNALGLANQAVPQLIKSARKVGARVLIDGAQAVKCIKIDLQKLDCDFYLFSGHKMYGPTGIGILYIKESVQKEVPPYQYGGGAVAQVTQDQTTFLDAPDCYEAGTQPIAEIIGLGTAIDYLHTIGLSTLQKHNQALVTQLVTEIEKISAVTIFGSNEQLKENGSLVSFTLKGVHPHDAAAFFDMKGICVRAGHHCAQPLAQAMGYSASIRVSFGIYNEAQEVTYFLNCLQELLKKDFIIKHHETEGLVELDKD